MLRLHNYAIFETEEEFDASIDVLFTGEKRFCGGVIEKPNAFPVCFRAKHYCMTDRYDWIIEEDINNLLRAIERQRDYFSQLLEEVPKMFNQ